jgi:hypothetical protein
MENRKVRGMSEVDADLGKRIAASGGVTRLHQIIDLVEAGYTPERIKEWCQKQIAYFRREAD